MVLLWSILQLNGSRLVLLKSLLHHFMVPSHFLWTLRHLSMNSISIQEITLVKRHILKLLIKLLVLLLVVFMLSNNTLFSWLSGWSNWLTFTANTLSSWVEIFLVSDSDIRTYRSLRWWASVWSGSSCSLILGDTETTHHFRRGYSSNRRSIFV